MIARELLGSGTFWSFLLSIDKDLAESTRQKGCSCGGRLHCANYPRAPRGGPVDLPEEYNFRFSFSCDRDGCRKRATPPSVRFSRQKGIPWRRGHLDQRHAARSNATPSPRTLEVVRRRRSDHHAMAGLLARQCFAVTFLEDRARSSRTSRGNYRLAAVASDAFLRTDDPYQGWAHLLRFLSPITVPGPPIIEISR